MNFYWERLAKLDIGSLSIHRAKPLILDRLNSLLSLLLNVFLKVVRRLNYNIIYNDDRFRFRRIGTLIHKLTREDFQAQASRPSKDRTPAVLEHSILRGDYDTVVGQKIGEVAEAAANFGTTLWFTPEDELAKTLDKLIAAGEFTMCYNLIEYLETLVYNDGFTALRPEIQTALTALLDQCKTDWARFKDDPFFLL